MSEGIDRVDGAMSAVQAVLRSLDQTVDGSFDVLRAENNVVLGVGSAIVAKAVERAKDDGLQHEAAVIDALAASGAPIGRPARQGVGPFETEEWTVILLERMVELPPPTADEIVASLAELHTALASASVELPVWIELIDKTFEAWKEHPFAGSDEAVAKAAYTRFVEPSVAYKGPVQPIHGDAWSGQVMQTIDGLRWIDFESACIGPREWDLAGFEDGASYGNFDESLWRRLRLVKSWTVAVWCNVNMAHSPELAVHVRDHLNRLNEAMSSRVTGRARSRATTCQLPRPFRLIRDQSRNASGTGADRETVHNFGRSKSARCSLGS